MFGWKRFILVQKNNTSIVASSTSPFLSNSLRWNVSQCGPGQSGLGQSGLVEYYPVSHVNYCCLLKKRSFYLSKVQWLKTSNQRSCDPFVFTLSLQKASLIYGALRNIFGIANGCLKYLKERCCLCSGEHLSWEYFPKYVLIREICAIWLEETRQSDDSVVI